MAVALVSAALFKTTILKHAAALKQEAVQGNAALLEILISKLPVERVLTAEGALRAALLVNVVLFKIRIDKPTVEPRQAEDKVNAALSAAMICRLCAALKPVGAQVSAGLSGIQICKLPAALKHDSACIRSHLCTIALKQNNIYYSLLLETKHTQISKKYPYFCITHTDCMHTLFISRAIK